MRLILASASPRRRELLAAAGFDFQVVAPDDWAENDQQPGESPVAFVARMARQKAANVAAKIDRAAPPPLIVACDTVADCNGLVLGKPRDREHAREMLLRLSGQLHQVHSGLCLWPLDGRPAALEVETTVLAMDAISAEQIDVYLDSGKWVGKAGAFGYQDGLDWVHVVQGSESNVVGLPMELLHRMLASLAANP